MFCILKTIIATVVLMLVGTNLIGLIMRRTRFLKPPSTLSDVGAEIIRNEYKRISIIDRLVTFISITVTTGYLFALFYFWNVWLASAGLIIIFSRIPDLLIENKVGHKLTKASRPKGLIYKIAAILFWGAIVLIWYSFYVDTNL